eukprot:6179915-Pleurochrysis_carterae.AAC.1
MRTGLAETTITGHSTTRPSARSHTHLKRGESAGTDQSRGQAGSTLRPLTTAHPTVRGWGERLVGEQRCSKFHARMRKGGIDDVCIGDRVNAQASTEGEETTGPRAAVGLDAETERAGGAGTCRAARAAALLRSGS